MSTWSVPHGNRTTLDLGMLALPATCVLGIFMILLPVLMIQENFAADRLQAAVAAASSFLSLRPVAARAAAVAAFLGATSIVQAWPK
jgi:hypothetical protein